MARIPDPQPGLVIRYAYLWQRDATQGRDEGTKYRPAVVVLTVESDDEHGKTVLVAPITHRKPNDPTTGLRYPR